MNPLPSNPVCPHFSNPINFRLEIHRTMQNTWNKTFQHPLPLASLAAASRLRQQKFGGIKKNGARSFFEIKFFGEGWLLVGLAHWVERASEEQNALQNK